MSCTDITPISAFVSTNLNNKIDSFNRLGQRILRALGAPMVTVEIHHDQLYENIGIACEMFTKYAGYTEEYLVFDSNLYDPQKGIRLDQLFSITPSFNKTLSGGTQYFVCTSSVSSTVFSSSTALSSTYSDGIFKNQILTTSDYSTVTGLSATLSASFVISQTDTAKYVNSFDYDVMDYRRVIDVVDIEQGSSSAVNSLFTIEQSLAQQTYFSSAMGNYGFDLVSWYLLKNWLDVREKMFATKTMYTFDPRTQQLVISPSPGTRTTTRYYGVISCYVEKPVRDIIKEQWVYQYALALSKMSVGMVRGKYTGTTLFGGGSINAALLEQGTAERDKLEEKLYTGSPGLGDAAPPMFFVG